MSGSRIAVVAVGLVAVGLALAGCGWRDVGLADRCAAVARAASPQSLDITLERAEVKNEAGLAEIAGTQNGAPIAAECRFEHEVLTSFRWRQPPFSAALSGSSEPSSP
jgi:hypothetical protein